MLSPLLGHDSTIVAQSVDALWERLGFDDEQLSKGFNAFAVDDGEALQRIRKAGFHNSNSGTQYAQSATGAGKAEADNNKSLQNARVLNQAIATSESISVMIEAINQEISEIDARIETIDARTEEIAAQRQKITEQYGSRNEIIEEQAELARQIEEQELAVEQALIDYDEADLAHQRALIEQERARTPDAMAAAAERVDLTREEAEAARDIYLNETATLDGYERHLAELNGAIQQLDSLSVEDLALLEERGDLVMDRQQLITLRERLEDPAISAAIDRGDLTHQDLLDMMPEELQPGIMDSLTTRFQEGWDYGLDIVSNAYDSAVNGLTSMTNSLTSTISGVFARATGAEKPETPEEPTVQDSRTPSPALQTHTM